MTQKQIDILDFFTFAAVLTLALYFLSSAVLPAEPTRLEYKPEVYRLDYRPGEENQVHDLRFVGEGSR